MKFSLTEKPLFEFLQSQPLESAHVAFLNSEDLCEASALELLRILKAGGVCIVRSRTKHLHTHTRLLDEAGFRIRDIIAHINDNVQSTSFSPNYIISKSSRYDETEKQEIINRLSGKRTMRLRQSYMPIIIATKPFLGRLIDCQLKNDCGFMNTVRNASGQFASNTITSDFHKADASYDKAFLIQKPRCANQDDDLTVAYHLLSLFADKQSVIVDCSGEHGQVLAASVLHENHEYFGNYPRGRSETVRLRIGELITKINGVSEAKEKSMNRCIF